MEIQEVDWAFIVFGWSGRAAGGRGLGGDASPTIRHAEWRLAQWRQVERAAAIGAAATHDGGVGTSGAAQAWSTSAATDAVSAFCFRLCPLRIRVLA